jgi:uncharacterized membrane protein YbaN (DUF454 family)
MKRTIYIAAGGSCTGLGVIGIFVPGLPTTVFLLMASYFFARSSPRLHRWLVENPKLGPFLKRAGKREMTLQSKITSLAGMWAGISLSSWACAAHTMIGPVVLAILGLIGTGVLTFYIRTVPASRS